MSEPQFPELEEFPYESNVIMKFVGGSQLHGAKLEGKDDVDWYGIFIEPPTKVIGLDHYEHFVWSTNKNGVRGTNTADDVDVTLYSLRKWATLACKGNPSVLHFLFAGTAPYHPTWEKIREHRDMFVAKSHLGAFLGYANAQLRRLYNQRGGKDCNRPFLEEQHGYDTKYAMHITRLLVESKELMETGAISLPNVRKDLLVDIRMGKFKLYELEKLNDDLEREALAAKEKSQLRDHVDRRAISELIVSCYLEYWENEHARNQNVAGS